jgi:hypothetical protein
MYVVGGHQDISEEMLSFLIPKEHWVTVSEYDFQVMVRHLPSSYRILTKSCVLLQVSDVLGKALDHREALRNSKRDSLRGAVNAAKGAQSKKNDLFETTTQATESVSSTNKLDKFLAKHNLPQDTQLAHLPPRLLSELLK